VRCVSRIQPLLQAIQSVAMALSRGSMRTRTARTGSNQLDEGQGKQQHTPEQGVEHQQHEGDHARTTGGRKLSMAVSSLWLDASAAAWPVQHLQR